jgi:phage shock protein C
MRSRREHRRRRYRSLYRSRNGIIMGVCKGIADQYEIPVFWLRVGVVFLTITTGIWPVLLVYFALAFYAKPEPVIPFENESDNEFYGSYTNSRSMALHRIKKKFEQLQNRLRRMEDVVTSREFSWDMKMGERK